MGSEIIIYTDGGARGNPGPSASAFIVIRDGKIIYKHSNYLGIATNNEAEYKAVIAAGEWLQKNMPNGIDLITFNLDSELVVSQLNRVYKVKSENLKPLYIKVKNTERIINTTTLYKAIPREKNRLADKLVNEELDLQSNVNDENI